MSWWLSGGISAANCVAAYQAKGAASYAASLVNLANPGTYNLTEGTAPDWASGTGWTFDVSNSEYLICTNLYIGQDQTWSFFVRYANMPTSGAADDLCALGVTYTIGADYHNFLIPNDNNYRRYYANGGSGSRSNYVDIASSGVIGVAGKDCYFNGSNEVDQSASTASNPTLKSPFIGAHHNNNSPQDYFDGDIIAVAIYNTTITGDQVTALTTAMNAL